MKNHLLSLLSYTSLLLIFSSNVQQAKANNFYFSTSTGDDSRSSVQAQNPSTPWKTLTKLNSYFAFLNPGDSILFNRGEEYTGSIIISKSGTSSLPIVISAYGIGSKPIITGFTQIDSWIDLGGGIWESTSSVSTLSTAMIVTINGVLTAMGRYPNGDGANGGWLPITTHNSNSSLTTSATLPANFVGGEAVIKPERWVQDRCLISAQSGNTLSISGLTPWYNIRNGFGFFILNHPYTLDKFGEWYYNSTTKKLRMFFGTAQPSSYIIKVANSDQLVTASSKSYVKFDNLKMQGANNSCFYFPSSSYLTFQNCDVAFCSNGFRSYYSDINNVSIENCNVSYCLDYGIVVGSTGSSSISIRNSTIKNIGTIHGAASSGDAGMLGISISGSNNLVEYNTLDTIGYIPIRFEEGNNNLIKNNFINYFTYIKDDGGGIYTYEGSDNTIRSNNRIIGNIITNAIGYGLGTDAVTATQAYGIYMDQNSNNVLIDGNTVAFCSWYNIYFNDAHDIKFNNNTVYGNPRLLQMQSIASSGDAPVRNMVMKNNKWYVNKGYSAGNNFAMIWKNTVSQADLAAMFVNPANCDSNYYCRPLNETANPMNTLQYTSNFTTQNYTLAQWKINEYGFDAHSKGSPLSITDSSLQKLLLNTGPTIQNFALDGTAVGMDGRIYQGTVTLQPFTSLIVIDSVSLAASTLYYPDVDNDGYGNSTDSIIANAQPTGYVIKNGDCDDSDSTIHPGALEVCDGKDNDCDGNVDEGCDVLPIINISDTVISESGDRASVRVNLSTISPNPVYVIFTTVNGTGINGYDYRKKIDQVFTIPAGDSAGNILVRIIKDTMSEDSEYFYVQLSSPFNASLGDSLAKVTIIDDDTQQNITDQTSMASLESTGMTKDENSIFKFAFSVRPNPSTTYFTVVYNNTENQSVTINVIDLAGRLLETKKTTGSKGALQLGHNLRPGIYIIEAILGNSKIYKKVIKLSH